MALRCSINVRDIESLSLTLNTFKILHDQKPNYPDELVIVYWVPIRADSFTYGPQCPIKWRHMRVMASQITNNSAISSTECSGWQERTMMGPINGYFWGNTTTSQWTFGKTVFVWKQGPGVRLVSQFPPFRHFLILQRCQNTYSIPRSYWQVSPSRVWIWFIISNRNFYKFKKCLT